MPDAYVELPIDPTDEELARDWTLSAADLEEVRKGRGPEHRQRFAVQLCALRALGRFVDDFAKVPVRIANHIGRQLGLPPSLFIEEPDRPATASEQEQRIREYLGYRAFDGKAQEQLKRWLADMVAQGADPEMLPSLAITTLRAWKVEIPAPSTLERHISNATAGGAGRLWQRFLARLPPDFREAIDRLLEVADGDRYSTLFQLKQYPPEATPAAILSYLDRFELLRSMGVERIDVSDLNTKIVEQLASLGHHYGARDLRRFTPAKRYALVTCFLVEAQKTTLDHLVEMNRQFLTGVARRSRRAVELRQKEVRQRAKRGSDSNGTGTNDSEFVDSKLNRLPRVLSGTCSSSCDLSRRLSATGTLHYRWILSRCYRDPSSSSTGIAAAELAVGEAELAHQVGAAELAHQVGAAPPATSSP